VLADYVAADRRGTRELVPQLLVLLPEERAFYLVFRHGFDLRHTPTAERTMRLRLEPGWYGAAS
jgi:hypothetical protein